MNIDALAAIIKPHNDLIVARYRVERLTEVLKDIAETTFDAKVRERALAAIEENAHA